MMLLVVAPRLTLSFLLQHQGKCLRSAKTAREAIHSLQTVGNAIEGVVLDDAIPNSSMITGYIRNKMPQLPIVSWKVAQRNSPFRTLTLAETKPTAPAKQESGGEDRYVWTVQKPAPSRQAAE